MKIVGTGRPLHDARGKVAGATVYAGDTVFFSGIAHIGKE